MVPQFRPLSFSDRVFTIAEIGNNHEGNFDVALKLIEEASKCGVDAVKFQTFKTEYYVNSREEARFRRLKSFELSYEQFEKLRNHAHLRGLFFLSTPFDLQSLAFLETIADGIKISSGDNNYAQLIDGASITSLPLIISTGLTDLEDLKILLRRVSELRGSLNKNKFALLHCVAAYPVPDTQANLRAIHTLQREFGCRVGYSDHTLGVEAALSAVSLGATIIEKHFTLSKTYSEFRDHQLSSDPIEMALLIKQLRRVENMLGDGVKTVQNCEEPLLKAGRRGAYLAKDLGAGAELSAENLLWLRPANEFSPEKAILLSQRKLKNSLGKGEALQAKDLA